MTTAVHIPAEKINGLLHISVNILAQKYPQHHFILFTEKKYPLPSDNCTEIIIVPKLRNKLLQYYRYNYKLPALLKRYNADVFISAAGMVSLKTDTPQYLLFENDILGEEKKLNRYYKKVFHTGLLKAESIFVSEDIFRDNAVRRLPDCAGKIITVYHDIGEKIPVLTYEEQKNVKEKYTKGHEFFLYPVTAASASYLISLLKAFSQLKNRQHSSMKLVLLLQNISEDGLINDFKNYKYREEVIFIKDGKRAASELLRSAYALIYFCEYALNNIGLKALQAGIPVIAENTDMNISIFGDAAMFSERAEQPLAEKMMRLYKDEYERSAMILKGRPVTEKYNAAAAANKIWETLTRK